MAKISRAKKSLRAFFSDESGQGMVEYILIIGLIVLFIIVALVIFRDKVKAFIDKVNSWLDGQSTP